MIRSARFKRIWISSGGLKPIPFCRKNGCPILDIPFQPMKSAWRPFEHGPRNCIGQERAMMGMKPLMILILPQFDIEVVYHELALQSLRQGKNTDTVDVERAF